MARQEQDPSLLSIREIAELFRTRELSPTELTGTLLERIKVLDPRIESYETVMADGALADARRAEQELNSGHDRGLLHGVPIALKDIIDTKGVRTACGSKIRTKYVPTQDAGIVEKLRSAGAVIVGKTTTHEFAFGVMNPAQYKTRNPWNVEYGPGGSSGGSGAAVAAGLAPAAIGTDTGGSVRIPAAVNGISGLRPTYGRVTRHGIAPLSWSIDTVGPMTKTAEDTALVLAAIAGYDPRDPGSAPEAVPDYTPSLETELRGLRVGVPRNYFFEMIDSDIEVAVLNAVTILEDAGAEVQEVQIKHLDAALPVEFVISLSEAAAYHRPIFEDTPDLYFEDSRTYIELGLLYTATQYLEGQQARHMIRADIREAFEGIDVLVTPTLPKAAARVGQENFLWPSGEEPVITAFIRYCCPFSLSGIPAISVPCGFTSNGLPIGMQIVGRPFEEATVLRTAHQYQKFTDWHLRKPPIAGDD